MIKYLVAQFSRYGIVIAFSISLASVIGSLYYEFVRGFEPCVLCWWLRILIYPQVLILAIAMFKKDYGVRKYSIALSSLAVLVSLYQSLLPLLGDAFSPCSASGVSCTKIYVIYFDFITIPVMALSASLLMLIAMLLWKPAPNESSR